MACRGPARTPRCKCGSRPGSVARALGVQSREIWQVTTGSLYDQLEPTRPVQTPITSFSSFFTSLLLILKYYNTAAVKGYAARVQQPCFHGTTATRQAFPFKTAANGAFACGFVSVLVCACVIKASYRSRIQEHSLKNRGAIQLHCSCSFLLCCLLLLLLCSCITP